MKGEQKEMDITEIKAKELITFEGPKIQSVVVPFYQRQFVWTPREASKLYKDLETIALQRVAGALLPEKFLAAMVFQPREINNGVPLTLHEVVDGQQRMLTTKMLAVILKSLMDQSVAPMVDLQVQINSGRFTPQPVDKTNLLGTLKYWCTDDVFEAFLDGGLKPPVGVEGYQTSTIWQVFTTFLGLANDSIKVYGSKVIVSEIYECLCETVMGCITLGPCDDAQAVFESLNGTGLRLTGADHIRNLVMNSVPYENQETVYYSYWSRIMEFSEKCHVSLDEMVQTWLRNAYKTNVTASNLYTQFRNLTQLNGSPDMEKVINVLERMVTWMQSYMELKNGNFAPEITERIRKLDLLNIEGIESVGLMLLGRLHQDYITSREVIDSLNLVESYAVRQLICERTPGSITASLAPLVDQGWITKRKFSVSMNNALSAMLLSSTGASKFPNDADFDKRINEGSRLNRAALFFVIRCIEEKITRKTHDYLNCSVSPFVPLEPTPEWVEYFESIGWSYEDYIRRYGHTLVNYYLCEDTLEVDNSSYEALRKSLKKSSFTTTRGAVKPDALSEEVVAKRLASFRKACFTLWPMAVTDLSILEQMSPSPAGTPIGDLTDVTGWKPEQVTVFGKTYGKDMVKSWKGAVALMLRDMCLKYLEAHSLQDLIYAPEHEFKGERVFSLTPFEKSSVQISQDQGIYARIAGTPNKLLTLVNNLVVCMGMPSDCIRIKIK